MSHVITRRQSTFWEFAGPDVLRRVHFIAKKEFAFVQPVAPELRFEDDHPLLTDYSHGWVQIFVSSPAARPKDVLAQLDESIRDHSRQWRSLAAYRAVDAALAVLRDGYGSLGGMPIPIAAAISSILTGSGVRFTTLGSHGPRGQFQALTAGANWVVAESFRVEELPLFPDYPNR